MLGSNAEFFIRSPRADRCFCCLMNSSKYRVEVFLTRNVKIYKLQQDILEWLKINGGGFCR